MSDRLLNSREVSELLGVTDRTLHNYRYAGAIAFIRFGWRTIRYRRADVERFIQGAKESDATSVRAQGLREGSAAQPFLLRPGACEPGQGREDALATRTRTDCEVGAGGADPGARAQREREEKIVAAIKAVAGSIELIGDSGEHVYAKNLARRVRLEL